MTSSRTDTTPPVGINGREAALDGIRGLAIILVLIGHLVPHGSAFTKPGVTVFFGLSGYLITRLLITGQDGGALRLRAFYIRRFFRLAPAFLLVLAVTVIWCVSWNVYTATLTHDTLMAIFYVSNWGIADSHFTMPMLHLWSLSVEEQFYLLWPALVAILGVAGRRRLTYTAAALGAASLVVSIIYASEGSQEITYRSETAALLLLLGCLCALLEADGRMTWTTKLGAWPLAGAIFLVPVSYYLLQLPHPWVDALVEPLIALGAAMAAIGARDSKVLSARVMVWFGLISYSLYLWQTPVRFNGVWDEPNGAITFVVSVALAWLTWRFLETPARRYGRTLAARYEASRRPVKQAG